MATRINQDNCSRIQHCETFSCDTNITNQYIVKRFYDLLDQWKIHVLLRFSNRWRKQPWRWGASCIPTKYQLRHAERAINGASVLIRRCGRLCFDPYESARNLAARHGDAIKKGRLAGKGRTCTDTYKGFLWPRSLRAPWLASCRDRCISWNEGRLHRLWYCGLLLRKVFELHICVVSIAL